MASEVLTTTTPIPASLVLTSVQPNSVSSSFPTELALTGQGFLNGAVVLLDGYGALATSFVSSNLLTAVLPAGVPAGTYTVRVLNPNAESAALPNALTVRPPSETATPVATATPLATAFVRPQLVINSYGASSAEIVPNSNLAFEMTLANAGQIEARNVSSLSRRAILWRGKQAAFKPSAPWTAGKISAFGNPSSPPATFRAKASPSSKSSPPTPMSTEPATPIVLA
ncbi:MAG: IPT/TIG domain-containing protein [Chloroflexi bacterium]|nr:IPT/TIG domain-containing protein [Chloroflexota bacterium]